jgi:hypothetical protein
MLIGVGKLRSGTEPPLPSDTVRRFEPAPVLAKAVQTSILYRTTRYRTCKELIDVLPTQGLVGIGVD